jgi:hypothetical protein
MEIIWGATRLMTENIDELMPPGPAPEVAAKTAWRSLFVCLCVLDGRFIT